MTRYPSIILSIIIPVVFAQAQSPRESTKCLVADIVIAADMSTSVASVSDFIWDAVKILPERYELEENKVHMSLIRFNKVATEIVELTDDNDLFLEKLEATKKNPTSGDTLILSAMLKAQKILLGSTRKVPKFLIIISDGQSMFADRAMEETLADTLRHQDINVVGVCTPPSSTDTLSPLEREWTQREEVLGCAHLEKLSNRRLYFKSSPESLSVLFEELMIECP